MDRPMYCGFPFQGWQMPYQLEELIRARVEYHFVAWLQTSLCHDRCHGVVRT